MECNFRRSLHPVQVLPVRCAPVASSIDNSPESALPPQIMPLWSINKKIFYPGHKETLSPVTFGKICGSHSNRVFLT